MALPPSVLMPNPKLLLTLPPSDSFSCCDRENIHTPQHPQTVHPSASWTSLSKLGHSPSMPPQPHYHKSKSLHLSHSHSRHRKMPSLVKSLAMQRVVTHSRARSKPWLDGSLTSANTWPFPPPHCAPSILRVVMCATLHHQFSLQPFAALQQHSFRLLVLTRPTSLPEPYGPVAPWRYCVPKSTLMSSNLWVAGALMRCCAISISKRTHLCATLLP